MTGLARSGPHSGGRARGAALAIVLALCAPAAGRAAPLPVQLRLGLLGGTTLVDPHLGDYQWDTQPRAAFGAIAGAAIGRAGLDARVWRSSNAQRLELPGGSIAPSVHATTLDLVAGARVAAWGLVHARVTASAGRVHLGYHPDHVAVDAGGTPVEVALRPTDEWIGGAGLALERPLPRSWSAGLSVDRRFFSLDTAHRSGAEVIDQRETFGDWSLRFALSRTFHPGSKGIPR